MGRRRLDTKRTEIRGRESHTCSDDLFNFHKRYINLLGKLADSFVGVLVSEGIDVDLHPWGALLEEISRVNIPKRARGHYVPAALPSSRGAAGAGWGDARACLGLARLPVSLPSGPH